MALAAKVASGIVVSWLAVSLVCAGVASASLETAIPRTANYPIWTVAP